LHLLKSRGYTVEDRWLTGRGQTDAFKQTQGVSTTPQTFINGVRIGGYDDLRRHFGLSVPDPKALTYRPVIALFCISALMAAAAVTMVHGTPFTWLTLQWFIAFSMALLAFLKLRDLES